MEAYTRTKESPEGTSTQSADIIIGAGTYEISAIHVILGGSVPVATITNVHGNGSVRFEQQHQYAGSTEDLAYAQRLMSGHCTLQYSMENEAPKIVVGPGRIKSYIHHSDSVAHTLTVTYRRLYA